MRVLLTLAALASALPSGLLAQSEQGAWSIEVSAGTQTYAESSSLMSSPMLGLEALYQLTPRIAIGPAMQFHRADTDGGAERPRVPDPADPHPAHGCPVDVGPDLLDQICRRARLFARDLPDHEGRNGEQHERQHAPASGRNSSGSGCCPHFWRSGQSPKR